MWGIISVSENVLPVRSDFEVTMPMENLNKNALDSYAYLCARRLLTFEEFVSMVKEDFKNVSYLTENLAKVRAEYRKILKDINK